jgi:ADP-dependent phosphofructokinase/glucokinase
MSGNMLSRFTDFLTSDGEKPWRHRDLEFEESYPDKRAMMDAWEKGWKQVIDTVENLKEEDLSKTVYIRSEGQSVVDAIQRQIAHYAHHVGQILYQAKILKGAEFRSLSIPKGASEQFNQGMIRK